VDPALLGDIADQVLRHAGVPPEAIQFLGGVFRNPGVGTILANGNLKAGVDQLLGNPPDVGGALRTFATDPQLMGVIGDGLLALPAVRHEVARVLRSERRRAGDAREA
jgi:hypothetical protein